MRIILNKDWHWSVYNLKYNCNDKLLYSDIGTVEGYVMKYYSKDIDDILGMDMDYMLERYPHMFR